MYSVKHKRFRPQRCAGFDATDGTHLLQDAEDAKAEVVPFAFLLSSSLCALLPHLFFELLCSPQHAAWTLPVYMRLFSHV